MTKKIYASLFALVFGATALLAQEKTGLMSNETNAETEQESQWSMGDYKYSAKPKDAWELGVHAGHYFIDGDVDRRIPGGFGLGLHLRKAIHYAFSIRADLFYGVARGLDPQPWSAASPTGGSQGGGLTESFGNEDFNYDDVYNVYENAGEVWFPSHRTRNVYGALQGVINIGNLLFHKDRNKWNWYMAVGVGLSSHQTMLDLFDASGNPYTDLENRVNFTQDRFNTKAGRDDIESLLDGIYDGEYETEGFKKAGIFRLGDETNIHVMWTGSMGVSRKISKRFNIGIEHQVMATDNDYLDGIKFRTALDQTNNVDLQHYTNLRVGINIGDLDNGTEPLYWLNPLDNTFNDIAELKQRPVLDLTDDDADGIVDMLDQELNTPEGCAVDTRGITLDSDGDGLADCKDKEPYSPPGYEIDGQGIAMVPKYVTEGDVNILIDGKNAGMMEKVNGLLSSDCGKWFLPMIHFDLDKHNIKPEFYSHMHHVANVMEMCPNVCVAVVGHTDPRNSNAYNQSLSFNRSKSAIDYLVANYGIDRDRFKQMYGGEESPLSTNNSANAHYMNRRVEFRVCKDSDFNMPMPEGTSVGSGGSARSTGSTYSGNKNSGY